MGSAGRMLDTMRVAILFFALLAAFAVGDDPCDSTAPPEPAPAPSPAPTPAPSPAPTPGCADKPGDWKSSIGSTCAYGTPIVGAVPDDADGRTDDGRDCCPDDADRGSYFDIDNAGAGDTWVSLSSRRATKDCKKLPINLPALRWTKFPDRADV